MTPLKWTLLTTLYVAQFLPVAFFFMGMPTLLRDQGMAVEKIGLLYALGFVWVLKFLWAPLVDRWGIGSFGHYRGWLLLMQAGMAVVLIIMSQLDVLAQFSTVLILAVVMTGLAATQDIAADATACRLLPAKLRGPGNAIQIGGGVIGLMLGGGGMVLVYAAFGWTACALFMAALMLLAMIPVALFQEDTARFPVVSSLNIKRLWSVWKAPGMPIWALIMIVVNLGVSMVFPLLYTGLIDAGWSVARSGMLLNVAAPLASLVAVMAAGRALQTRSPLALITLALPVQAIAMIFLLPMARGVEIGIGGIIGVVLVFCAHQWVATAVVTSIMNRTARGSEGSDFTVQHSLYMLTGFVPGGIATQLVGPYGYIGAISVAAACMVIATLFCVVVNARSHSLSQPQPGQPS